MDNLASEGLGVNSCPYDKDDVIRQLKSLETYFDGDDIQRQHFKFCAAEIENAFDYLMARLRHAESERFSNG